MDLRKADDNLSRILRRVVDVPSFPAVVERLLGLSEEEQSTRHFANLIACDPGLASKVLRLVNSAFFSLKTPLLSIIQASNVLGVSTLRSLARSVSAMSRFKRSRDGLDPLVLWRHSLCVAILSRKLGDLLLPSQAEDLYIAGLLHDLGVSVLVHYFPDDYATVLRHSQRSGHPLPEMEISIFGTTHANLGYALASRWRLPALVCECIRRHEVHADTAQGVTAHRSPALEIVHFADRWSESSGLGLISPSAPEPDSFISDRFALAGKDLQAILESAITELRAKENDLVSSNCRSVERSPQAI
jgi:HD-like signal output (HDOD) protein